MSEHASEQADQRIIGPERYEGFLERWKSAMTDTVLHYSVFGTYCHDGGDLVADTEKRLHEPLDSETYFEVAWRAEDIVYEFEEKECSFCNDDLGN